jgi:DNA-binding GntR family transcriptional regulator
MVARRTTLQTIRSRSRRPVAPRLRQIRRESLSERAYRQLRRALMDGQYASGEVLAVPEIAKQLGTSITPVREAILRLTAEGGLEATESQSFCIPKLTPEQVSELQTIRILLEGEAAAVAALKASVAEIRELTAVNEAFVAAMSAGDLLEASTRNRQFHLAVVAIAAMPLLLATVEVMWTRMGALIYRVNLSRKQTGTYGTEHEHYAVLRGLSEHQPEVAREAIARDIRSGRLLAIAVPAHADEPPAA